MNFNQINQEFQQGNLTFKPITVNDRNLINKIFQDEQIKKYYIIPKEARQDYRQLVDYWLNDINNGAGTCWIIIQKGNGFFSRNKPCGFIAFEFHKSLENARISYAILSSFRQKGIATSAVGQIILKLKAQGVKRVEADIDRDNFFSEKVVEKHGFTANKRLALIDPEMIREGETRMRALWKKDLVDFNETLLSGKIPIDASINYIAPFINRLIEEIDSKGQRHPDLLIRYFHLLGRIKFLGEHFEKAQKAFDESNKIAEYENKSEVHENYFWLAKINEAKGEIENAKIYYRLALEKYNSNPNYISKKDIEAELNKEIINYDDLDFHVIKRNYLNGLFNSKTVFKVWEERMGRTGKYHFLFQTDVTEKIVGISENDSNTYNVPWELLREEKVGIKSFMVFCGWGDQLHGGHTQFNYYEIGVERNIFEKLVSSLITSNPDFFSLDKMRNVIGLENFNI